MAIQKPSIPKGTRDFGQTEMARRNYLFDTIRSVFRTYGYQEIQTPAQENLSTLLGKYGEEGDKLLFRIQNSGEKADLAPEKGLRYDLTVPFARYVVQHQNEISFPFKRFQIQPVWRADRPQKGRYREFYQCDVDVIGTRSQVNELELVQMVDAVFGKLGVRVGIHINNRKVLTGFAEIAGAPDKVVDITVAIDKLDKIGMEKVKEEMADKGLAASGIAVIEQILSLQGGFEEKLAAMRGLFNGGSASGVVSETGLKGLDELSELFGLISVAGVSAPVEIDLSLARGLNYYTGAIFEVKALDWEIGSICGGGRYDNLTGIFGLPDLSGVGISFGADRIYDVLVGLNLFPEALESSTQLLFAVMGADELRYVLPIAKALREAGVAVEVYPEATKLKKQFDYADKKAIPFISINGSTEMEAGTVNIKNLRSGSQQAFAVSALSDILAFLAQ
ncbi:MAG: histidine--tRNA ligase [Bacteroidales bacterium]|jgi:histidyl-tRNA synthetase|nr:histidine--tRNA ligase [Bacteroidales bacterium]